MSVQAGHANDYICPMHDDVRRPSPGYCSHCGMALIPEDARFPMLRHLASNPLHIVSMLVTAALMAAAMMMWHA